MLESNVPIDLVLLRISLREVAQAANRRGANIEMPEQGSDDGWNALCADLIEWIENA
jgi:hypothetical protein